MNNMHYVLIINVSAWLW